MVRAAWFAFPAMSPSKEALAAAFRKFDTDGSGKLGAKEIVDILTRPGTGATLSESDAQEIVNAFDTNADGELDLEEFTDAFAMIGFLHPDGQLPLSHAASVTSAAASADPSEGWDTLELGAGFGGLLCKAPAGTHTDQPTIIGPGGSFKITLQPAGQFDLPSMPDVDAALKKFQTNFMGVRDEFTAKLDDGWLFTAVNEPEPANLHYWLMGRREVGGVVYAIESKCNTAAQLENAVALASTITGP